MMRHEQRGRCVACEGTGERTYAGVRDRLFGVPGEWDVWRCHRCQSLWLDPRPVEEDIHLAYREYYTHDGGQPATTGLRRLYRRMVDAYLASKFRGPWTGSKTSAALQSLPIRIWAGRAEDAAFEAFFRPIRSGGRALDIGAGRGLAVKRLAELGWRAEGIDLDAAAVAAGHEAGVPLSVGDLASHGYADDTFDLLTMSHVIEHVHDPGALAAEALRVLRPGGELVVVTPNARSWLHRRSGRDWFSLDPPRHLQIFTRESLSDVLRRAGFEVTSAKTTVRGANTVVAGQRAFAAGRRFDMSVAPPKRDRLIAEMMQQLEAFRVWFDADAGEDLLVIARRP